MLLLLLARKKVAVSHVFIAYYPHSTSAYTPQTDPPTTSSYPHLTSAYTPQTDRPTFLDILTPLQLVIVWLIIPHFFPLFRQTIPPLQLILTLLQHELIWLISPPLLPLILTPLQLVLVWPIGPLILSQNFPKLALQVVAILWRKWLKICVTFARERQRVSRSLHTYAIALSNWARWSRDIHVFAMQTCCNSVLPHLMLSPADGRFLKYATCLPRILDASSTASCWANPI